MHIHPVLALLSILLVGGIVVLARQVRVRRFMDLGGDWFAAIAPRLFAFAAFLAGAILLFSGATPTHASRLGWINTFIPLPIVEASSYFASVAGVALIILARGIQRRLDAAYHLTVWLLSGSIVFALASALDYEQALVLSVMLLVFIPSRRYFTRQTSIFEERFTRGWIVAIAGVAIGTIALVFLYHGPLPFDPGVFWSFPTETEGPRTARGFALAALALVVFAVMRLIRPARVESPPASAEELVSAEAIVAASPRANAHLALLGDKSLLFSRDRTGFIMYAVEGLSWVSLGDPVASVKESPELIEAFITRADQAGGWPIFYRASPPFLHLYLEYSLSVIKLGEVARVPLGDFSLEGPTRRNLRRIARKLVEDGFTFEVLPADATTEAIPDLQPISDQWLATKGGGEKSFSLGFFSRDFIRRSRVGVVRQSGRMVAFVTLWMSGSRHEVEVDLMRFSNDAPPGIMRFALLQSMVWARDQGYEWFNLGAAPLSGLKTSSVTPVWNQLANAVRGPAERYYNFRGIRDFKEWFHPQWEPTYLISPGGLKRPFILANIAALISGSDRED